MKTSELEMALSGKLSWKSLSTEYQMEKTILFSRKDGITTSGDLRLSFDSSAVVVTREQIELLCQNAFNDDIDPSDVQFFATVILLSAFDFDNGDTENTAHFLSNPETGTSLKLAEIYDAMQMLHC